MTLSLKDDIVLAAFDMFPFLDYLGFRDKRIASQKMIIHHYESKGHIRKAAGLCEKLAEELDDKEMWKEASRLFSMTGGCHHEAYNASINGRDYERAINICIGSENLPTAIHAARLAGYEKKELELIRIELRNMVDRRTENLQQTDEYSKRARELEKKLDDFVYSKNY